MRARSSCAVRKLRDCRMIHKKLPTCSRRWPVRRRGRTADRFLSMDLAMAVCRRRNRFAKFALTKIRFLPNSIGLDLGASKYSRNREPANCAVRRSSTSTINSSIRAIRLWPSASRTKHVCTAAASAAPSLPRKHPSFWISSAATSTTTPLSARLSWIRICALRRLAKP